MLLIISHMHISSVEYIEQERPQDRDKRTLPDPIHHTVLQSRIEDNVKAQSDNFVYQPSMKSDLQHVQSLLAYWRPATSALVEPTDPPQYVAMETDIGGFNNIRMGFEFVVGALQGSRQTLVLPPAEGWYLLDWGPLNSMNQTDQTWLKGSSSSEYGDFWNLTDLRKAVPVLKSDEFWDLEHHRLQLPPKAQWMERSNNPDDNTWKRWWRKHAQLSTNCSQVCDLKFSSVGLQHIPAAAKGGTQRVFGCRRCNPTLEDSSQVLRNYVHYTNDIVNLAAEAIIHMGAFAYVAVHLRRNDFQYEKAGDATSHLVRLQAELKEGEALYLATDELDPKYIEEFKREFKDHRVFTAKDFEDVWGIVDWNRHGGHLEQVVCSAGRTFFAMPASTWSDHVVTMRKHISRVEGVLRHVGEGYSGTRMLIAAAWCKDMITKMKVLPKWVAGQC